MILVILGKKIPPVWLRSKARYSEVRPQARYTIHEQEIGSIGTQKKCLVMVRPRLRLQPQCRTQSKAHAPQSAINGP
jgi:hypothetical protein